MVLVSIAWTAWLIVLAAAPNQTANYLMGTTEFDDGNFWMIIDPEPVFMAVSVVCLGVLVATYVSVVIKMAARRNVDFTRSLLYRLLAARLSRMSSKVSSRFRLPRGSSEFWKELNDFEGRKRKIFNAIHKSLDLAVQAASLYRLLEDGVPSTLCYVYACLIALNSFSCAAFILLPSLHSAFVEVFVDTLFDMVFAVGWPIWWLWFSYDAIEFDRVKAHLNVAMYLSAWFERQARRMANSSEATLFMISFDALRMKSGLDLCLRMAMNYSFSLRLSRVVDFMVRQRRLRTPSKRQQQVHVRRPAGLIFVLVSIAVLVHTNQCITLSSKACAPFPECAAYAYRWSKTVSCPCRALIDVDKEPRSYEEWISPINGTNVMKKLAASGDLRVIEVINRYIPVLPDELQGSSELRSMILSYTGIHVIPDWAASFTNLEYLYDLRLTPSEKSILTILPAQNHRRPLEGQEPHQTASPPLRQHAISHFLAADFGGRAPKSAAATENDGAHQPQDVFAGSAPVPLGDPVSHRPLQAGAGPGCRKRRHGPIPGSVPRCPLGHAGRVGRSCLL